MVNIGFDDVLIVVVVSGMMLYVFGVVCLGWVVGVLIVGFVNNLGVFLFVVVDCLVLFDIGFEIISGSMWFKVGMV